MIKNIVTSEWVSLGHSDKIADYISEYLLDAYLEQDKNTRYAVEVQIKDNYVTLGGEVTSKAEMPLEEINRIVKEAVNSIGYTKEYQRKFGKECTICGDELIITSHIAQQSPNIAHGVNKDAWGDQGIFFGYFCKDTPEGQGIEYAIAKEIGMTIYQKALEDKKSPLGLDIKTQVTADISDSHHQILEVIVAVPTIEKSDFKRCKNIIRNIVSKIVPNKEFKLTVNGTGEYHIHGPIGDCGTTGRKLAVDFYGGRSRIGGGSPWTKDGTKADLTLNMCAYECAKEFFMDITKFDNQIYRVETELSCCIGKRAVNFKCTAYDEYGVPAAMKFETTSIKPSTLIKRYKLDKPNFRKLCYKGLFSRFNNVSEN